MPATELGGLSVHWREWGSGTPVLCLHETATTGEVWRELAGAIDGRARLIAPDRRGWGETGAPEDYLRTTIEEQSEDAARLLATRLKERAVLCGAGIGAVIALDLALRHPSLVRGVALIDPPLLAFVSEATEAISDEAPLVEEALREGGPDAALERYLAGGLPALGPDVARLPAVATAPSRSRALSLFAELGAVPAWPLPFEGLAAFDDPAHIVVASSTSPLVREASRALAGRLAGAELHDIESRGPPHLDAAAEVADLVVLDLAGR